MEDLPVPAVEKKITFHDEKPLPPPLFIEKSQNILLLIIPLSLILIIIVFIISNKKPPAPVQSVQQISPAETNPAVSGLPVKIPTPMPNWKTYTNNKLNFSLNYPTDWIVQEFLTPYPSSEGKRFIYGLTLLPLTTSDPFMIELEKNKNNSNLEDYINHYILCRNYNPVLMDGCPTGTSGSDIFFNGIKARKLTNVGEHRGDTVIVLLKDNYFYSFYMPFAKVNDNDRQIFDQILTTLTLQTPDITPAVSENTAAFVNIINMPKIDISKCLNTNPDLQTANWIIHTNSKYHYLFKYPKDAITFFNNSSDAPQDFNDIIMIHDKSDNNTVNKSINVFNVSIVTLKKNPETYNYYKSELEKVDKFGGKWQNKDINSDIERTEYLGQTTYIYQQINKDYSYNNAELNVDIKLFRNDALYIISFNMKEPSVSCPILSSFTLTQ